MSVLRRYRSRGPHREILPDQEGKETERQNVSATFRKTFFFFQSKEYYADQAPITVLKQMRSSIGKPRSQPSVPVPMLAAAAGAMAEETSFGRSRFSPIGTPPKEHY